MTMPNQSFYPGLIASIAPGSLADELDLQPGDELLSINDHILRDVIDVQFYAADESLELLVRQSGELVLFEVERDYDQPLGLGFAHPTFDTDIRRCNNRCPFCFVRQMPPGLRRSLYVRDDDYRYSFLHGQYITLTNLSDEDWERIAEQHPSPLYVSVQATELDLRRRLLGNPQAPDVMQQLGRLAHIGIEVHTQLVIIPGLNAGPHLERSLADLTALWPALRSVSIVPVGITRYHKFGLRPHTPPEAQLVQRQVQAWQARCLAEFGVRLAYLTDEWFMMLDQPAPPLEHYDGLDLQENGLGLVRAFLDEWQYASRQTPAPEFAKHSYTWVTGELFAPTLKRIATEFAGLTGAAVEVLPVANRALGKSVTVAGLLTGADVIESLRGRQLGDVLVLPQAMFGGPGSLTLDDVSAEEVGRALGRPLVLASAVGDVMSGLSNTDS